MTSNQFFAGGIDRETSRAFLEGEEHHHLARVVRIKVGDEVWLFNDRGNRFLAQVEAVEKDRTRLRIIRTVEAEKAGIEITLGQAVIKPKNMDLIVQKTTELGISAFVPLLSARSLRVRGSAGGEKKLERWRRIAREAAKQSHRASPPSIGVFHSLEDFTEKESLGARFYLSESGGTYLRDILVESPDGSVGATSKDLVFLVGPEGGWTEEEKKMLAAKGYKPVSLGKTVIRSETAAILAAGMISHFWNS